MSHNSNTINGIEPTVSGAYEVTSAPPTIVTVTTTGTLATPGASESLRLVRGSSASPITLTLPSAGAVPVGFSFAIKQIGAGAVTIAAASGQTIDGAATLVIGVQQDARSLYAISATAWEVY